MQKIISKIFIWLIFLNTLVYGKFYFNSYIESNNSSDIETFEIDSLKYLVIANEGNSSNYNLNSNIYTLNSSTNQFELNQSIETNSSRDMEVFTIGSDTFLAVANNFNGTTHTLNSNIYKFNTTTKEFELNQSIETNGALGVKFFIIGGNSFLVIANNWNGVTGNLSSNIYRFNGNYFELNQSIDTNSSIDMEAFTIGGNSFLAVANNFNDTTYNLSSNIYRFNGSYFELNQSIDTNGSSDIKYFEIAGVSYLVIANRYNGISYEINSNIYKFNGNYFELNQSIATKDVNDIEYFENNGYSYLAIANLKDDVSNYNINSIIYEYNSSTYQFEPYQEFLTNGVKDIEYFENNGYSYLAIANLKDTKIEIKANFLTLNLDLMDINLSENNITSILAYAPLDGTIENLYVYDYYGNGGYSEIVDGENNYSVPIYSPENNFTFEFSVTKDSFSSSWFYNFSDGKLYPDVNSSYNFEHELNVSDYGFTISLNSLNWQYYKFSGNLTNNDKNITDIKLYDINNFISFEQNLSVGASTFDLNFSEKSDYSLRFVTDKNQTWYYNFATSKIEKIDGGSSINLSESNLSADFDVSKQNFDDYHIDLNISLSDTNLSEHNVTSIFVYTRPDETIENLYVYDYYERGGYNTIIDGENNYSLSIYYPDNNFSFEFFVTLDGVETSWFYNFNDGKLYPDDNGSDEFKREINITDNNFTIDLNVSNWNYYEFNGTLFENIKSVTAIKLVHSAGSSFENNISANLFDINFSEVGNYSLELLVNDSSWWYYDFTTDTITSTPNGSYITLNGSYNLDLNVSPRKFDDFIAINFYEPTLSNTIDVSNYTKVAFNDTIDLLFETSSSVSPNRLEVLEITTSSPVNRVLNSNILSSVEINSAYADKIIFSHDNTKLYLIGSYIEIIDISNPNDIKYLGSISTGLSSIYGADISGDDTTIYISGYDSNGDGFRVFNVSNPSNILNTGIYNTLSAGGDVIVYDDEIFVGDESAGIKIFDKDDLTSPISFLGDINRVDNIALSNDGNTLFVLNYINESATPAYDIKVVDVSDYTNPSIISTYNTLNGNPKKIVTSKFQPILYVITDDTMSNYYLEVVNTSNPSTLVNYYTLQLTESSDIFSDIVDGYVGLIGSSSAKIYQFMPYSNDSTFIANPSYVNFGSVNTYSINTQSVIITNNSLVTDTIDIGDVEEPFSVYPSSCNLAPNSSCTIDITYYPLNYGSYYNLISLNGSGISNYIEVSGFAYAPYTYYDDPSVVNNVDNIDTIDNTIIDNYNYTIEDPFSDITYDFTLNNPISLTDENGILNENINSYDNFVITNGENGETFLDIDYGASGGNSILGSIDFFVDGTSKSSVLITDEFGDKSETTIDIPQGFETKIGQNGEILHTLIAKDGSFTKLSTSPKGDVDISIKTSDGKNIGFKSPIGTKVEVKENGVVTQNLDTKDSKTNVEVSKDGKTKVKVETVDGDGLNLDLDIEANTELRQDGSIIQKIENQNAKTELQASKRAEVKAVIENKDGVSIQLNPPKNAEVKVNSDNSITISNQAITNDGLVQSKMNANPDGSSSVEVNIESNARGTSSKKLIYSTRKDISSAKLEVLLNEQNSLARNLRVTKVQSGRIKATFSTRRSFSFKREESLRVINDNYNVVITPETSAKFEENLYFNDDNDLKLNSGKANIKTVFSTRSTFSQSNRVVSDKLQSTRREFSMKANKSFIEGSGRVSATLDENISNQKIETTINANQESGELLANILVFNDLSNLRNIRSQKIVAKKLIYSVRKEFSDAKLEVIENSSARILQKTKLKATYSTRSSFSFKNSNLREIKEVNITPLSEDAKFEENIDINGYRIIKLVEGEASITINGTTTQMVIDEGYNLPSIELREVELDITSTKDEVISLFKGWNLISSPIKEDISDKFIFGNYDVIWNYKNSKWFKNPNIIYYDEGFWIKSNVKQDINFTGESFFPNLKIIPNKWALVGSGGKIENLGEFLENEKVKEIYSYQDGNWSDSKTLKSIEIGSGFWIEKIPADENLTIKKGWNLISIPIDENVTDMSIFGNYKNIYLYKNGEWILSPEIIEPREGFWINSNDEVVIAFYGNSYKIDIEKLNSGWSLVGGEVDLDKFKLNSLKILWIFKENEWREIKTVGELNLIKAGDGFWIKK